MRRVHQRGFTITELMIATTIFSIVLLVALAGFLQIGHTFYKGVSLAQTQQVADQIFQDINGNFQTAANITPPGSVSPLGYHYFCVGNIRYTYNLGNEISSGATPNHSPSGNFGILKDSLPGTSACAPPCTDTAPLGICNPPNVRLGQYSTPTEMLGDKMRLANLTITNATSQAPNVYTVDLVVAYGDDDVLDLTVPTAPVCKGQANVEFCAVSQINTAVYRGWQQ